MIDLEELMVGILAACAVCMVVSITVILAVYALNIVGIMNNIPTH